jgi:hypothetical protein
MFHRIGGIRQQRWEIRAPIRRDGSIQQTVLLLQTHAGAIG